MSRMDLEQQAAIGIYFLMNEVKAKGNILTTAPLEDTGFDEEELEFDDNNQIPNKSSILKLIK